MGIQNALKYGLGGFGVDLLLYGMPNGLGMLGGALVGLFTPDAKAMDSVYDPTDNIGPGRHVTGGLGMFSGLFGDSEGRPEDPTAQPKRLDAKTLIAGGLAAALFGKAGGFSLPLYGAYLAGLVPYNQGGLEPLMWSSGVIPSNIGGLWGGWGATAGLTS